jgi:prolyl oligopeptidase
LEEKEDKDIYYSFTNYITPGTIYKYNVASGKSEIYQKPKVKFNPEDYVSEQVFYTSKDGTKVPMMINYKKGTKLDGKNPTILYSYGGFNISLQPSFSVVNAIWMENGGIYAVPNIRGGGEYGKNGTMQEPNNKRKTCLMTSLRRANTCSRKVTLQRNIWHFLAVPTVDF